MNTWPSWNIRGGRSLGGTTKRNIYFFFWDVTDMWRNLYLTDSFWHFIWNLYEVFYTGFRGCRFWTQFEPRSSGVWFVRSLSPRSRLLSVSNCLSCLATPDQERRVLFWGFYTGFSSVRSRRNLTFFRHQCSSSLSCWTLWAWWSPLFLQFRLHVPFTWKA